MNEFISTEVREDGRRIFYVDVGDMSVYDAERFMRSVLEIIRLRKNAQDWAEVQPISGQVIKDLLEKI